MAEYDEGVIGKWCRRIIEGVGGMNDYEKYETVIWHVPDRVAVADWTIRCLANPKCEGSQEILEAIIERRKEQSAK